MVHCLLRCDGNSAHRQKCGLIFGLNLVLMCMLVWITLLSVFLGNFKVLADILAASKMKCDGTI